MKLGRTLLLSPIWLVLAAAACNKNTTTAPTAAACGYGLASATQAVPAGGGSFAITLTLTSGSCTFSAASDSSWLVISGSSSGSATSTLTYTAAANAGAASRTGTITVQWSGGSAQLVVTQASQTVSVAGCSYAVSPAAQAATENGGSFAVTVTTTGTGCSWTASADSSWLAITAGGSGTASGTIAYSALANPDATPRVGTITVQWTESSAKVTVTESGVSACIYTLSPTVQAVAAAGGAGFTLTATRNTPNGCSWGATSSVPWITITGPSSGASPGAIVYSVDANAGASRSGVITVFWSGGSAQLTVNQAGPATTGPSTFNVSFAMFDPGRQAVPGTECQIRSLTSLPNTCTFVATANLPTAMTYSWNIQYLYGFQRVQTQIGPSATFSFSESCGQFSASAGGTQVPLSVQLTVTDVAGNTATVVSGAGNQPPLLITFYTCGQ
jgi:hypothetical protein